jgi:pimeloyl-ACP methyl ester carboxylesterase
LLHFHGWPSSRLEQFASEDLLKKHKLHWFSLDRPGYGETTFQPEHSFKNWARTVDRWATDRGLDQFHVMGFSGGGPFAQAIAAHLPHRALTLNLVASLSPFGPNALNHPPPWAGPANLILTHAPSIAITLFHLLNRYRKIDPLGYERLQLAKLHPFDQKILNSPETLERFAQSHAESMRQGVRHIIEDLLLYRRPWDFSHDSIVCPTRIWVGTADVQVPPECSKWLAKRISGATLTEYPGEAHYIAHRHADEILRDL